MSGVVETYLFRGNGRVPNSRLPVCVYRDVHAWGGPELEHRLRLNNWYPSWHSPIGMYPQHHFHSQAHELIAVTRGEITGLFGGHDGREVTLRRGDIVVIPAGVGHFGVSLTEDLFVTGAFPAGFGVLDFRLGYPSEYYELAETARKVPIPAFDPVFGSRGPLPALWNDADQGRAVPEQLAL
ncbi:cupin domain-containing protein [Mesorhizobium sp. B3-1-3]|uniref:cupin domain-containing protein n=1 Tax=unclassified Mesorhizobium TaxID=325217 RepID=UPI00112AECF6|nr:MULTISPECIES: cupin domain-containing protein [unclassified Mesorhizobium]TPI57362.1 cupin domain-containing protein [Mesorhizobium sp. B3-1-8]TPI63515.1 cupin domain-containing protein [Mesorhizobium sp. B3-1-3]